MKYILLILLFISANVFSACDFDIKFNNTPQITSQKHKLSEDVELLIVRSITKKLEGQAVVATNVTCQHLVGANYKNTKEEWSQFVDNAIKGLGQAEASDLELNFLKGKDKIYKGELPNLEYLISADFGGNKQLFTNVAILDLKSNSLVTISVSGNQMAIKEINEEFARLVEGFSFN